MGFSAGHCKEKHKDGRPLLLPFWPLLPLLSPRPSPRLMLTPTCSMVDMDWDTLAMVHIMESVRLKPSPRLLLTPTFCMEDTMDMVLDMDTLVLDTTVLDIMVMASVRLSLRLMLTPTFCTEDTMNMVLDMDTLVLDTMVLDTEFMESALLMPSQKLTPTFCMEDIDTLDMPDTMDTPMVDMPTMDKLLPLISKWTANHPCFLYQ